MGDFIGNLPLLYIKLFGYVCYKGLGRGEMIPNKIPRAAFPPDPGESPRVDLGV